MTDAAVFSNTIQATARGADPKGSRPHGKPAARLEREAAVRRALFAASLAGFVALFGLIAAAGKPTPDTGLGTTGMVNDPASTSRVVAEVPITGLDGGGAHTLIRIVAPEPGNRTPHVRTRAS